jgi:hypothetical protein
MLSKLNEFSNGTFDPVKEALKFTDRGHRRLPFVFVFGRAFWTVSLYGANVYVCSLFYTSFFSIQVVDLTMRFKVCGKYYGGRRAARNQ